MLKYIIVLSSILIIMFFSLKNDDFDDETLKLGLSIPRSGIMHAVGDAVYSGASAYFLHANEKRLLKEVEIELLVYDDKYEPELTLENVRKLMDENVFAFFGLVGTPTVKKVFQEILNSDIPLIAPFSGAGFLRNKDGSGVVNFRSSYKEEIDYILDYLGNKKNISRYAVFYQNDDYGEEGFVSLLQSLQERDLQLSGEGTYKRNTLSIRHAFHEIKSSQPEAVFMIGAYKANALFIKTAKKDPLFKDTLFCNISFGNADEMIKELDYDTKNLFFSQVVPSYMDGSKEVILEYQQLMQKYYPEQALSFISLEAFLAAKSVVEVLKNMGEPITKEKFFKEFQKLSKNSLGGVQVYYKNKQLHNEVYLFKYKDSKFIEVNNED